MQSYGNATVLSYYIADGGGELLYLSAILTVWDNFNIMTVILWGTYVTHNNKII